MTRGLRLSLVVGAWDRGHRKSWLPAALMVLAAVLAACGGGGSTPEDVSSDDETLEARDDVEGTIADPRLVPVCESAGIFGFTANVSGLDPVRGSPRRPDSARVRHRRDHR